MAQFRCVVCSFVQQGWKPPSHCPICGAASNMFQGEEDKKDDAEKEKDDDSKAKR
jgi:rubredoxin